MNFRNISAWSIRHPMVPIVIFTGLMLLGLMSFSGMKVQDNPDVEFPVVIVTVAQPGAAPTEIEKQITQRVEAAVQSVEGMRTVSSTAREGSSLTVVEFTIGTDVIEAVNEVKSVVDQVRGELPDGILEPRVYRESMSNNPVGYFAVAADDMTLEQLSWFVDDTVANRLLSVPGMADVSRAGGVDREIVVTLDPAKMQSLGVTASQINAQLRQINVDAGGGVAEIAGSRQSVRVLGNAESAFALSQSRIPLGGGRSVKLSDVADVRDSFGEVRSIGKFEGKQVVTFGVTRAKGESDVSVYEGALEELDKIKEEYPGVSFTPLFTSVDYTKGQYTSSMAAMIEGAILAVIVVFFFLRDWRATIIAALAIPLSAIPTFWFMDLMGFTLNTLSLLALGLVAGVLVDDAIVEIENIVRHMRMGKSAYQASIDAADEIGLPVVATTFSIVAVFLPVGLMPGISGQFFKNFGLTVVAAVLMSLAVARMITPMVAAYFLEAKGAASHGEGKWMDRYERLLRWTLWRDKALLTKPAPKLLSSHVAQAFLTTLAFGVIAASFVGAAFFSFDFLGRYVGSLAQASAPPTSGLSFVSTSLTIGLFIVRIVSSLVAGFLAAWVVSRLVNFPLGMVGLGLRERTSTRTGYYLLALSLFLAIGAVFFAVVGLVIFALVGPANFLVDTTFYEGLMPEWMPGALAHLLAFIPAATFLFVGTGLALVAGWMVAGFASKIVSGFAGGIGGAFAERFHWRSERMGHRFQDRRMWMMGIGATALLLTGLITAQIPSQFFPTFNSDFSRISVQMVPGTTLEQTEDVADRVARIVNDRPEVNTALARINEGSANVFITLNKDREVTQQEFERAVTPLLQEIPDARASFQSMQGPGGGGRPIRVMLSGSDPELLREASTALVEQMKGVEGVVAPRIDADLRRPEVIITPRTDLAASLGVTTAALSQTIRIATIGDIDQNAAKFSLSDRQVPIRVRLSTESRRDLSVIRNLPVPTASGGSVPLSRVAEISLGSGPTTIQRYNQNRRTFVSADLAPGVASGDAMQAIQKLPIMQDLPLGVTNAPFGEQEWQIEMIYNFQIALIAGVLLVFAVLVLLYHRVVSPLVNMGSLFLAPFGGMLAVWLAGQPLSMPVLIGTLMLFGIVAKNSILLIDFAIEEMARGTPKYDAIVEAGRKRAQPIVMTTVAMTAGMVPTALSLSGDGAFRAPMGTVVIGGLIVSTLLTLLIVPAGFSLADGLEKKLGPWLRERLLTYRPGDENRTGLAGEAAATPAE
ncbi:efflux RND transporter permease subunit [Altererythrobacter sp. MF3-039]|uniref:efflux RND transporter permease subunit n=1 Tax=Altererythrobacter sp. MF3-039 TaxID=3252901 RepID=UPI00390C5C3D